jgi:hypothetical protein
MRAFVLLFLLLAGCAFEAPSILGSRQACIDWVDAIRTRALACGVDLSVAEAAHAKNIASCDDVVWTDTDGVYGVCIPELQRTECFSQEKTHCDAYIHFR